jgi:hypothetical protein
VNDDLGGLDDIDVADAMSDAWCEIPTRNGRVLRCNSYQDLPDGCRFVAVLDDGDNQIGWWPSTTWTSGTTDTAAATLSELGRVASGGYQRWDEPYSPEWVIELTEGQLRIETGGHHARVCEPDGDTLMGGSLHWTVDEFLDDGELVMGGIMGATAALA